MTPDPCALFIKALHEDKDRITSIVHEKMEESSSLALTRIPDGGMTNFNDNLDKIEYRMAEQAHKSYAPLDDAPRDLEGGQSMPGRDCNGVTGDFTVSGNEEDPNACHDSCLLEFGQGYKIRTSMIFRLSVTTPVVCAYDFIRQGKAHVEGFFDGMTNGFTDYGMKNFEANLLNYIIQYGEANASVNSKDDVVLTTGGFNAPPTYRLSIPYLRRYRQYMIREGGLNDEGLLDIECPRQDALDAIARDVTERGLGGGGSGTAASVQVNIEKFEDVRGTYLERSGTVYDGIRFIFNEMPVRGYFKPTGQTAGGEQLHTFVRVYHWRNEVNDEGGLSWQPNHDYDKNFVWCDGIRYRMNSLAFVINAKSFKRYGLGKPIRPKGENQGANYEVLVLDGSYIDCNDFNDKFRLAARHQFRFQVLKPELSGAIAYVHSTPQDYVIEPTSDDPEVPTQEFSSPEEFEDCDQTGCCPDTEVVGKLLLNPCGPIDTVWEGDNYSVILTVERTGDGVGTAQATVTINNDSSATGAVVVDFADGETGIKDVAVPIVVGDKATADITAVLTKTGGDETLESCDFVTITVIDGTA